MASRLRTASIILAVSALLGIAGTLLFCGQHGYLLPECAGNVIAWLAIVLASAALIGWYARIALDADGVWLAVPACFFAASFIWQADGFLRFWNGFLLIACALLIMSRCRGPWSVRVAAYTEYARLAFYGLLGILTSAYWVSKDLKTGDTADSARRGAARSVLSIAGIAGRGIVLSVIPIVVFGLLFVNADPVFNQFVKNLFNWDVGELARRIGWIGLFGFKALGVLYVALLWRSTPDQPDRDQAGAGKESDFLGTIGPSDVVTALALMNLLFATFVAVQFRFLFGGESVIRAVHGLTYATYARSGFFELAWVAGLAIPILLLSHWLTRNAGERSLRRIQIMTALLTALLAMVITSAYKRMALYELTLGLTENRLLVSVFIGAIGVVLAWFLLTTWRGRPRQFAFGLLVAAMLTVGGLDLCNSDALVVKIDARRAEGLQHFDAGYLSDLGADAVPSLVTSFSRLEPDQQPEMAHKLLENWGEPEPSDWRMWNSAEVAAREAVRSHATQLKPLAAKAPPDTDDSD